MRVKRFARARLCPCEPRAKFQACRLVAIRSLWKSPGFAILAVVSLSAGLGLAAALAGVADLILFRPLPVAHPERMVRVFTASAAQPLGLTSYPDFDDLRRASRTTAMVAESQILVAVAGDRGSPAQVRMGLAVTPDYFDVLGVPAALGRTFRPEEAREGVVVLAHAFSKAQFGSDPRILGQRIFLGGTPFTVIGVAPENFGLDRFVREDFYVPIQVYESGLLPSSGKPTEDRSRRYLNIYARLRDGATMEQARAEIALTGARIAATHPQSDRGRRTIAMSELSARLNLDRSMPALAALLVGVAALMFVVACANVAGLLLVRAQARATEIAVEIALGASRARLLADNLAAGAALAIAGAFFSLPLAWAATRVLEHVATLPSDLRFTIAATPGMRVFLIVLMAAAIAALVCGSAPALAVSGRNVVEILKSRREGSRPRWRDALVTMEIALASALVACGFSLFDSISSVAKSDPGFRADHVLTMALDPAQVRYEEAQARAFYAQVLDRVRRITGVKGAALAQSAPLGFTGAQRQIEIAGEEPSTLWINIVSPDYFDLLRIPLLSGRGFDDRDTAGRPLVAIVNEVLAKRGGVGAKFRMNGRTVEVIGVARTAKYFSIGERPTPFLYLPFSQNYASRMTLDVETRGDPAGSAHAVVAEIRAIDAAQPVSEVRPASEYLRRGATFHARVALDAMGAVGVCGLVLALAGLYGVVAQNAIARRREIGIRMALGARPWTIAMLMLGRAARMAGLGICAGSAAALVIERWMGGLITGARNSSGLGLAIAIVLVLSVAASLIPSLRAAGVDPARCLREE